MLVPARKLAFVAIAGSLTFVSSHCFADSIVLTAARIGLSDAVALTEQEMGDLRGTGFVGALSQGLLGTLTPTARAALAGSGERTGGALTGFISALLAALPPGNTVSAQINDQPTVTLTGTGPLSLGCGSGLACAPGTSLSLSSSGNPPTAHASISFTR